MEVFQLCSASMATGSGTTFKLPGWRTSLGAVKLQGSVATKVEVQAGTNIWSDIDGALWTAETIDALFAQPMYIRSYITAWTSGQISVRLGY